MTGATPAKTLPTTGFTASCDEGCPVAGPGRNPFESGQPPKTMELPGAAVRSAGFSPSGNAWRMPGRRGFQRALLRKAIQSPFGCLKAALQTPVHVHESLSGPCSNRGGLTAARRGASAFGLRCTWRRNPAGGCCGSRRGRRVHRGAAMNPECGCTAFVDPPGLRCG